MNRFYDKIPKEIVEKLPVEGFNGEIFLIENKKTFLEILPRLRQAEMLGFDTETKPAFKKGEYYDVSLLQLATLEQAFLFKLDKLGFPDELAKVLENKNVIKAGVAINDDIKALRKLKRFSPEGFVELQAYSSNYGIEDNGLKKLTANLLNFRISKKARLTDWASPQYTEEQRKYAATDAWVSFLIYEKLTSLDNDYKIIHTKKLNNKKT